MDKQVHFQKLAQMVLYSLPPEEQKKSNELVGMAAADLQNPDLAANLRLLSLPEGPVYSMKLNDKLRIIFEIRKDKLEVLDIINIGLARSYFNKPEHEEV